MNPILHGGRHICQQQKKKTEGDLPAEYLASPLSKQQQKPPKKTEEEIKEEEELQLAIAISQSEAEKGNKKKTSDDADLELAIAMSKKEAEKSEKKTSTVGPPISIATTSAVTGESFTRTMSYRRRRIITWGTRITGTP